MADSRKISAELVRTIKRTRFNPIKSLDPVSLARQLDSFAVGHLRDFALLAAAIKRRDDVISVALPKREKAVSRRDLVVNLAEGVDAARKPRAEEHQEALQYFWDNATATHALDRDQSGGAKLLVRQMMSAVGLKYAVHEIVWEPRKDDQGRDRLTATFVHVPLEFFEATTGKLRFLATYLGQNEGTDMLPGEWLVTVGDGIMEALAVGYMFKQLSLRDWVSYNELFGTPIRLGKTNAQKGSPEWDVMKDALEAIGQDFAALVNGDSSIEFITADGQGAIPFPALVDRMDRALATICRGADLSTMSAGEGSGQGASLQGDESDLLEQDDAEMISETLQRVDRLVIRHLFGEDPLAYAQIVVPERTDNADVRANITTAVGMGVPVGVAFLRDQLGLPAPVDDETLLTAPAPATPFGQPPPPRPPLFPATNAARPEPVERANTAGQGRTELFRANALAKVAAAQSRSLQPLAERFEALIELEGEAQQRAAAAIKAEIPALFATIAGDADLEAAFFDVIGTAFADGALGRASNQTQEPSA